VETNKNTRKLQKHAKTFEMQVKHEKSNQNQENARKLYKSNDNQQKNQKIMKNIQRHSRHEKALQTNKNAKKL